MTNKEKIIKLLEIIPEDKMQYILSYLLAMIIGLKDQGDEKAIEFIKNNSNLKDDNIKWNDYSNLYGSDG